jgi:biotin operon repressor
MVKQHSSKSVKKLFREIESMGFKVERKKSGGYTIRPPDGVSGPVYSTHGTESSLHPIRREFKRLYNISLEG